MKKSWIALAACAAGLLALPAQAANNVSTFDDLLLGAESHFGPTAPAVFTSGAATFGYNYTDWGGCCWDGWTYSNHTDVATAGFENQYSSYAGSGAQGSANYGLAYVADLSSGVDVALSAAGGVSGAWFSNTTYAALSMRDGDGFAKKFGGASGNDADYLLLTITGLNASGQATGVVDFYLADYRFADNSQDYIVKEWSFVDLSGLGTVSKLNFKLSSSDNGAFGMNTPAYFAMDGLTVAAAVPEPSALLLSLAGVAALALARRRLR